MGSVNSARAHEDAGRWGAQQLYPGPLFCEHLVNGVVCGEPAERHHVDGDTHNNARSNVRFLCRKHHHTEDGRCQRESYRRANSSARRGRRNVKSLVNLVSQQQRGVRKSASPSAKHELGTARKTESEVVK